MNNQLHEEIIASLAVQYNRPLISNVYRGDYVEGMIAHALGAEWRLVNEYWAWAPWDIECTDSTRIEVKQSAALQPWSTAVDAPVTRSSSFDIYSRREGWTKGGDHPYYEVGRPADIYIFAYHGETDPDIADHRRAEQWQFFVVQEHRLPDQKTISLNPLQKLAAAVTYDQLAAKVEEVAAELPFLKAERMRNEMPLHRLQFTVILEEESDGGYSVHCPALPGCVSQGDDRRAALANIKEAIGLVLPALERKGETPDVETPALLSQELNHILKGREQDGLSSAGVSLAQVKVSLQDRE